MTDPEIMRTVLWFGSAFNALVALMLMYPSTLGTLTALPSVGSIYYRWMLTFFVLLFSATYAWLALTPTISRPIVILSAVGKTGTFIIALVCLARGEILLQTFSVSIGDPSFAIYFFLWLRSTAVSSPIARKVVHRCPHKREKRRGRSGDRV